MEEPLQFWPYDWGPYSGVLQSDVSVLLGEESLEVVDFPYRRYGEYRTTRSGERVIADAKSTMQLTTETSSRVFANL